MYVGRFAPSPTGALHFGSLLAALASFLDAKSQLGLWLLRIDDIDPPREIEGASAQIIATLQAHGLLWDKEIIYQSQRYHLYQDSLEKLLHCAAVYPCNCSRKEIIQRCKTSRYDGYCLSKNIDLFKNQHAWRFNNQQTSVQWRDGIFGTQTYTNADIADFILQRRDRYWAYQLAVTVDDAQMGITDIVRGSDLLSESAKQLLLINALELPQIQFCHIPVITNQNGQKLSKQNLARPLNNQRAAKNLYTALQILGQNPDKRLQDACIDDILQYATQHWKRASIPLKYETTIN
jgi:glutamyl-Q tRNA(Asp) synthetase